MVDSQRRCPAQTNASIKKNCLLPVMVLVCGGLSFPSLAADRQWSLDEAELPGLSVVNPQGAFYVLPDFSAFYGPEVSAQGFGDIPDGDTLCRYLLEVAHVALVPGEAFGVPECLRISYAASMDTLTEALDRIEAALKRLIRAVPAGAA